MDSYLLKSESECILQAPRDKMSPPTIINTIVRGIILSRGACRIEKLRVVQSKHLSLVMTIKYTL